ncbi:MAG: hypothetical protein H5U40_17545, partial [Polyangiaceae bacterium]|nr:hypothetical protein [Polyangiaceae bacterium]
SEAREPLEELDVPSGDLLIESVAPPSDDEPEPTAVAGVLPRIEAPGTIAAAPAVRNSRPRPRSRAVQLGSFILVLGSLGAVGYFATRTAREAIDPGASPSDTVAAIHAETSDEATSHPVSVANVADAPPAHVVEGAAWLYGRSLPMIVSEQAAVGEGQGLLRVEAEGALEGVQLLVGERSVGAPPLDIALDEGLHELAFRSGDQLRYRYVFIRAGESRIVPAQ